MPVSPAHPTTVRTTVSAAALAKVGRLFNGTARDALIELLQNARRAGASRVSVDIVNDAEDVRLVVRDDGAGVADPALLFALGASGWDEAIARREDPAGMGVFSLAGRAVVIRSRARGAPAGWRVAIDPDAWESGAPLAVEHDPIAGGTEFRIAFPAGWNKDFEHVVADVARYHPLAIEFGGRELGRDEWLDGAIAIEAALGCRIGVFRERSAWGLLKQINFKGLTVMCDLPMLTEIGDRRQWTVRVDIVDAPALQLVLPARKEMVENAALAALRDACEAALYRAIAAQPEHRLAYADWRRAAELGVTLPEAAPRLRPWTGSFADMAGYRPAAAPLAGERLILVDEFDPDLSQSALRALTKGPAFGGGFAAIERRFEGYAWYDRLRRIVELEFTIDVDDRRSIYGGADARDPALVSGRVDRLTLDVIFADGDRQMIMADLLAIAPDWSGLDEAVVLIAPDAAVEVQALVELLEDACFSSSDDREADSWQTQRSSFLLNARQMAVKLLLSDDEAILDRIAQEVAAGIRWLVPAGRRVAIEIAGTDLAVRFAEPPTA